MIKLGFYFFIERKRPFCEIYIWGLKTELTLDTEKCQITMSNLTKNLLQNGFITEHHGKFLQILYSSLIQTGTLLSSSQNYFINLYNSTVQSNSLNLIYICHLSTDKLTLLYY